MLKSIPAATLALVAAAPVQAQDFSGAVDALFEKFSPTAPGCVVGVDHHGERLLDRAYGTANMELGTPLTPETRFDAGSLQKQFIAAAVLLLVEDGRVALTDDIRTYFPELEDYGHVVRVDHLLTHTSGIRDWVGLRRFSADDTDALSLVLRQRGLDIVPGEEWRYSNGNFLLLKTLVERVSGTSFADFARTRLFEPLGMTSTIYGADVRAVPNHALAYEKEGEEWRQDMLLDEDRGPGALVTTAADLLRWNQALTDGSLGAPVTAKLQEPARLNNGRMLSYARGLTIDENRGGPIVWHTGSAAAYKALLVRYPDQELSIAILCNAGDSSDRMRIAAGIFDVLVPGARSAPPAVLESVASLDVSGRAGLYVDEAGDDLIRLIAAGGRLRILGGPPLATMAEDRFRNPEGTLSFRSEDEFEIRFSSSDAFEMVSMEGDVTRYRRVEPWMPSDATLELFAGRWESEELGAVFEIAAEEEELRVRLNGSRPVPLAPVMVDTFQVGQMTFRFVREEQGRVVRLIYGNPAFRNVEFTR